MFISACSRTDLYKPTTENIHCSNDGRTDGRTGRESRVVSTIEIRTREVEKSLLCKKANVSVLSRLFSLPLHLPIDSIMSW